MKAKKSAKTVKLKKGDALIIIDVINDLDFAEAPRILPWFEKAVPRIKKIRTAFHRQKLPVIYVNDNFGDWKGDFTTVLKLCLKNPQTRDSITKIIPSRNDLIVLKPRHSIFFHTSLLCLLEELNISRLILAGVATNLCVLFSAHDAHMLKLPVVVLSDCCAAESDFDHNVALEQLKKFCGSTICNSEEVSS